MRTGTLRTSCDELPSTSLRNLSHYYYSLSLPQSLVSFFFFSVFLGGRGAFSQSCQPMSLQLSLLMVNPILLFYATFTASPLSPTHRSPFSNKVSRTWTVRRCSNVNPQRKKKASLSRTETWRNKCEILATVNFIRVFPESLLRSSFRLLSNGQ